MFERVREQISNWIRPPRQEQRQSLIKFSTTLPQMIGTPDEYRSGTRLGRLIGHYGDEVWVYVAVSKVAQSAASVPLRVRRGKSEEEESEIITEGELPELLLNPNPFQSSFDFIEQHQTSLDLAGETFIYLDRGPSGKGTPVGMYVLPLYDEETMTVIRGKSITPDGVIEGYVYNVSGEKEVFLSDEIIHIWYTNPLNPFRGLAPLRAAALSVESDLMAQHYNAAFFTNSAEPRGHYEVQEGNLTEPQRKRFQAIIEARHRGYKKAHRPLLLTNVKWVSTQLSPKDAEFLEQRKYSREEIIAIYGVRPVVVGLLEHNPQANAEVQWRDFWTATMQPKMTKLTNSLNNELAPIFGEDLVIEWDYSKVGPLQENYSQKVIDAEKLNKIGYPINMINRRLNLGFPDVPWGDTVFINPLLAPVESFDIKGMNGNGNGKKNGSHVSRLGHDENVSRVVGLLPEFRGTSVEERKHATLRSFEIRTSRRERSAERKIRDFFHVQERRTLRNLKSEEATRFLEPLRAAVKDNKKPAGINISVVFDVKEETEEMQEDATRPILRKTVVDEMLTFIASMKLSEDDFDFVSPSILRFLERESFKDAKNITETTRDLLAEEFKEALGLGETIKEISERVERVFDERVSSSETIARTETIKASNFGNQEAGVQAGMTSKSWISSRDERVRDEHKEIDDSTTDDPIPITSPFRLSDGSELMFPGDSSLNADAGQVINCRCTTLYFFEEEK
jgi:HK97 family phage portal protein